MGIKSFADCVLCFMGVFHGSLLDSAGIRSWGCMVFIYKTRNASTRALERDGSMPRICFTVIFVVYGHSYVHRVGTLRSTGDNNES